MSKIKVEFTNVAPTCQIIYSVFVIVSVILIAAGIVLYKKRK
ncbi:hypothetical protein HMPREF3217_01680 [Finegoldia magna]|nr:hypothetical protein HMPREF3217_01680 [Finegoldia magna]